MTRWRKAPLLVALVLSILVTASVFGWVTLRSDLADLLPAGGTMASRLMLEELRSGPASRLLLIGIEGAPEAELAGISDHVAEGLRKSGRFALVENGRQMPGEAALQALFSYRYALTPSLSAEDFSAGALRKDFQSLLSGLQSSASPLVEQYGLPDPTGAFAAMMAGMSADSMLRSVGGVWFAQQRGRALMLAQMAEGGMDFGREDAALATLDAVFASALPKDSKASLLISGPALFAHDAAASIRHDVRLLSLVSGVLVAGLPIWRFRSLWVAGVIAIPLMLGAAAGALAVQAVFGFVHGITLGFGMTMLGVTVDYPVLLIGHRKQGEAPRFTLARIGHAFALAVICAALGLSGMVFAQLPGLSQMGVFSVTGILVAAGVTRFLLPWLIAAAGLAPVAAGNAVWLARVEGWRRLRPAALGVLVAAALCLALTGLGWDGELGHLSPVPAHALAVDAELRGELGAPETGQALIVQGASAEAVLEREEDLSAVLGRMAKAKVIAGADDAAQFLPSLRTQRQHLASLPDGNTLHAHVDAAAQGLGFSPDAFMPFEQQVARARTQPPIGPDTLPAPMADDALLRARLGALLFRWQEHWFGLVAPRGLAEPQHLADAIARQKDVTYIDIHAETNGIASGSAQQAWPWLLGGAGAAVLALAAGLHDAGRLARVLGSIAAALLVTVALLRLSGQNLTLVHVMALQFVAGIGLDYALFFSRPGLDEEERLRTLRTLVTCNAMALLTFGLLCLCRTPLLRDIGMTVSLGIVCTMGFAFLLAGVRPVPA